MTLTTTGQGWADCVFHLGERTVTLTGISDITDVLGDLARLGLAVATGADRATASFDREPLEWRIVATGLMDANGNGPVSLAVFEFERVSDAPLSEGKLFFVGDCETRDLAWAILDGVRRAMVELPLRGFTFFPIPTKAIDALAFVLGET
jgi:hypothetical protein